jgi:phage recombination protein Bet
MSDYLNSLSGKEIQFRVNACVSKGMLKNVEHFEADCETIEGALPFKAVTTQKFGAGNTYTKVITLRQNVAEGKAPYILSEPAAPEEMNQQQYREEATAQAELAGITDDELVLLKAADHGFSQVDVLLMERNGIIPKGTPQAQIAFFLKVCALRGMNPMTREIYLIERKKWDNDLRRNIITYQITVSIEGARVRALATGDYAGLGRWTFDGLKEEDWMQKVTGNFALPETIGVTAYRMVQGNKVAFRKIIVCSEFIAMKEDYKDKEKPKKPSNPMYGSYPFAMLSKVAEMHALRAAFADALGGLYVEEEFSKEKQDLASVSVQQGTVVLSLPEASAKLDIIEGIQDLAERKKALQEVYTSTEHLQDTDLMTRISDMTNA